jgi:hypothetical protein
MEMSKAMSSIIFCYGFTTVRIIVRALERISLYEIMAIERGIIRIVAQLRGVILPGL